VIAKIPVLYDEMTSVQERGLQGWTILDSKMRRLYQVFFRKEGASTVDNVKETRQGVRSSTVIQSFDLDTFQPLRRRVLDGVAPLVAMYDTGGGVVHAVDEAQGRIFLAVASDTSAYLGSGLGVDMQRPLRHFEVIDERAFDAGAEVFSSQLSFPPDHRAALATHTLSGVMYHGEPGRGRLLMLWADTAGSVRPLVNHQLVQWGVDRPTADSWLSPTLLTAICGRARLNGAGTTDKLNYPLGILRGPTYVAFACQKSEGVTQVVRVSLDAAGKPVPESLTVRLLPRRYGDTIADQRGERLHVRSVLQGGSWWTYDGRSDNWVGVVGVTSSDSGVQASAGIDPVTGRLYSLTPNHFFIDSNVSKVPVAGGFGFVDARLDPVPQFKVARPDLAHAANRWIGVDPAAPGRPARLFVQRGLHGGLCHEVNTTNSYPCGAEPFIHVMEDREPLTTPPDDAAADRYTTDVEERDGVTAASFDRAAAGFGARVLLTGGASAATTRTLDAPPAEHGSACLPVDREVVVGEVQAARASNVATSAVSHSLRVDPTTALDLQDPARRCWATPRIGTVHPKIAPPSSNGGPTGTTVGSATASCTADEVSDQTGSSSTHRASARCVQREGEIDARGHFDGAAGALHVGEVAVSSATSRAWVERDGTRGRVTRVESTARGVQLGTVASIGLIQARASTWATGRFGTATSEFVRTICNVRMEGFNEAGCLTEAQVKQLAVEFNKRFVGNGEMNVRSPDASFAKGTPGGYQAAVQRDRTERLTDTVMNRDDSKAVPALELIMFRDDPIQGAGRQVFQFAAVEAASQYGIYCLFGAQPSGKACNSAPLSVVDADGEPVDGTAAFSAGVLGDQSGLSTASLDAASAIGGGGVGGGGPITRLLRRLARLPEDILRLITSGPSELLLTAGIWLLLWLPCCLSERRRAARRAVSARTAF
jgi:hypothetical protein